MAYLGVSMIVRSLRRGPGPVADAPPTPASSLWRAFAIGAGTNLLNPKIGVFYIATIPQFIPHGTAPLAMGLLLAAVHAVLSLAWFAVIIAAAGMARHRLADPRAVRVIDRVAGVVLVGFAAKLALSPKAV
jgi:threonine/homoserine/homoserine lactone efflux protein